MSALKVKIFGVAVTTFLLTTAGWLLVLNLTLGNKQIDERGDTATRSPTPHSSGSWGALLGPPYVNGNRVQALLNGDEIFPSMLDAIRGAQHTITFETYIYWSGMIGR